MKTMAPASTVLLCAATRWEAAPLAARLRGRATVLQTGMGAARTAEALSRLEGGFSFVLSTGFAGALQPGMETGDLVLDMQGLDLELVQAARAAAETLKLRFHFGKVVDAETPLSAPEDKARLGRERRASAVDMESAQIRAWAESRGTPFLVARVVLDRVDQRLPSRVPEGEDAWSLLRYAAQNVAELPLLLATGLRQRRAMPNLSAFLDRFLESL
ncbi:MAG: hypothetical protein AAB320_07595 [Elusimicrobiota bacterium]